MPDLNRFFKNVLAAIVQEFDQASNPELNRVLPAVNSSSDMQEGIVTMKIQPGVIGQVQFRGTWWNARCNHDVTLLPGQTVVVLNRNGNTLYVEPGFMLRTMTPMLTVVPHSH